MAFDAFRSYGMRTYYGAQHTAWQADMVTSGLIFCFLILAFSFYIILPGTAGWGRLWYFIRVSTSLFIGAVILVTQFSVTWEVAETKARTKYKAGSGAEVNVSIGVLIGFNGVNITLKGDPDQIKGETIDYNERFSWEGLQGRLGFGPNAGRFNQEYRAAQFRGLPLPILWAAEYFTFDGEGIRWGRFYRQAGWYAHILLWLAFPLWLISNILFCVLLRFGAYFLAMTGFSMVTSNVIWSTLRNVNDLEIPFTDEARLEFSYGLAFWLCLWTGLGCVVLGLVIFIMDKIAPAIVAEFFNVDVLQDSEQILEEDGDVDSRFGSKRSTNTATRGLSTSEADGQPGTSATDAPDGDEGREDGQEEDDDDDDDLYLPPPPLAHMKQCPRTPAEGRDAPFVLIPPSHLLARHTKRSYRSGESRMTMKFQKPRRRPAPSSTGHVLHRQPNIVNEPQDNDGPREESPVRINIAESAGSDSDEGHNYANEDVVQAMRLQSFPPRS